MQNPTLFQKAYTRIQAEILAGSLPPGRRVSETSLAARLGLGRAPVREALRQLHSDGVMRQIPRYGTVVQVPRRRDVVDIYELREALETYAVGKAVERIGPEQKERLRQLLRRMGDTARALKRSGAGRLSPDAIQEHLTADMAFHAVLVSAAGNVQIADTIRRKRVLARILATHVSPFDLPMLSRVYRFHRRILRAVERGDAVAARRAMAEHVRTGMREMLEHFDRRQQQRDHDEANMLAEADLALLDPRMDLLERQGDRFLDPGQGRPAMDDTEEASLL